jgi:tripartite-type tricarboxylate transporter receptor subunit TctC
MTIIKDILRSTRWLALMLIACCGVVSFSTNAADEFPSRPIQLIVPFPPGSGTDILARIISVRMSRFLGQSIVVMNRPGASTIIGSEVVASAPPDGYTLILASYNHAINPSLFKTLPYDPVKAFSAVGEVGELPFVLVVNPSIPAHNLAELVALLRQHPGQYSYASTGNGTPPHVAGELFKKMAGLNIVHVPYKGSADAITALIGGQVPIMFANTASVQAQINAGRLHAIAVTTQHRIKQLPSTPTMVESGYPGFDISIWTGILAPAHTPSQVITRLNDALRLTLTSPDVTAQFAAQGADVIYSTPMQFSTFVDDEIVRLGKIASEIHLRVD